VRLAVVIVTYNSADHVGETLRAVERQLRDDDELIVVDNASSDGTGSVVRDATPRVRVLEQTTNLGFAGGCNTGVAVATAPLVLLLNPDAEPAPGCLDALRATAGERPAWGAWQPLVTMDGGRAINTSGGVTHFLGLGWAGRCEEPVGAAPDQPAEINFASGAALCMRREAWERVGRFDERYFMYGEDLDLGLRLWLSGYGVGIVPAARVRHDYAFAKGERKWFLLERNRWWTVLSDYPTKLLLLVLPALLATEVVLLGVAARGGWLGAKLRAQAAVLRQLPQILERRRAVQSRAAVGAASLAARLSDELDNPYLGALANVRLVVAAQRAYWRLVLLLLGRERGQSVADAGPPVARSYSARRSRM
jgi:N-acetylglucosaminyl-diphospho-decaprenol L-rhamnosyltransferase